MLDASGVSALPFSTKPVFEKVVEYFTAEATHRERERIKGVLEGEMPKYTKMLGYKGCVECETATSMCWHQIKEEALQDAIKAIKV